MEAAKEAIMMYELSFTLSPPINDPFPLVGSLLLLSKRIFSMFELGLVSHVWYFIDRCVSVVSSSTQISCICS
jgi:hypothetical protein